MWFPRARLPRSELPTSLPPSRASRSALQGDRSVRAEHVGEWAQARARGFAGWREAKSALCGDVRSRIDRAPPRGNGICVAGVPASPGRPRKPARRAAAAALRTSSHSLGAAGEGGLPLPAARPGRAESTGACSAATTGGSCRPTPARLATHTRRRRSRGPWDRPPSRSAARARCGRPAASLPREQRPPAVALVARSSNTCSRRRSAAEQLRRPLLLQPGARPHR